MSRAKFRSILMTVFLFIGSAGVGSIVGQHIYDEYFAPPPEEQEITVAVDLSELFTRSSTRIQELAHIDAPPITWEQARHLTKEQMGQYWMLMRDTISDFSQEMGIRPPSQPLFIPSGGFASCHNRPFIPTPSDSTYQYCPARGVIQIGQGMMWEFYEQSWLAPAVTYGHEAGHSQQWLYGHDITKTTTPLEFENQADCLSGVFTAWIRNRGFVSDEDIRSLQGVFLRVSENVLDSDRVHGSFSERWTAFKSGLDVGTFDACTRFAAKVKLTS